MMSGSGAELLRKNLSRRKRPARDAAEVEIARDAASKSRLSIGAPAHDDDGNFAVGSNSASRFDEVPMPQDADFGTDDFNPDEFYNDVDGGNNVGVEVSDGDIRVRSLGSLTLPTESVDATDRRHSWNKRTVAMMQFLQDQLETLTRYVPVSGEGSSVALLVLFEVLQLKTLQDRGPVRRNRTRTFASARTAFEDAVPLTS